MGHMGNACKLHRVNRTPIVKERCRMLDVTRTRSKQGSRFVTAYSELEVTCGRQQNSAIGLLSNDALDAHRLW